MSFTVIYDACVLYPATLRDLLVELGASKFYNACWTNTIHDEWMRNVLANKPHLTISQLERTRKLMDVAVPGALITDFETLIPTLELPDPNDRHVLAAALQGKAQAIVTFNLVDFPKDVLEPLGLEAIHPDAFVMRLIALDVLKVVQAIRATRTRLRNPPRDIAEHLKHLKRQGLGRMVAYLEPYQDLL